MWSSKKIGLALCLCCLPAAGASAEVFTLDNEAAWGSWQIPQGLVQFNEAGHLELVKFRKDINAVSDAHRFTHPTQKRGEVSGGIWRADSNGGDAGRIIDGDRATFWRPDPADQLAKWQVEIDLGRPVLAKEIRLFFPDEEGARPFRQFKVLTATGARIQVQDDVYKFNRVYQTTQPNRAGEIVIDLADTRDTTRVLDGDLRVDLEAESRYQMVQFIRFAADEQSEAAALAEIEVIAVGDNLSPGVLARGGSFENGLLARDPQNILDGSMDTSGNIFTTDQTGTWEDAGLWWQVDMGALFWVDNIFMYWKDRGEALSSFLYDGFNAGKGYAVEFSDGRRTTSGEIDFTALIDEPEPTNGIEASVRRFRYIFEPRKIRYILWHGLQAGRGWYSHPMEFMVFSPGYPAQVTMRSGFIDLGQIAGDGRPKAVKSLSWEADLPADTKLQLRSRSGSTLGEVYTFHDRQGGEVTQERWAAFPVVLRGDVDTTLVAGDDWSEWSNFYQFSGEAFQSDNPRRFIELELIVSTEIPEVAPVVRSLSLEFEDALVKEAKGRILPRQAAPNQETRFAYTLWPAGDGEDQGFDLLRLPVPGAVAADGVEIEVGGSPVSPAAVQVEGDTLLAVTLADAVLQDSLVLRFTARVLRNATSFNLELGNSRSPGLWQSVTARERQAQLVFLPQLADSPNLIGDLRIDRPLFTPNGDGVNDVLTVDFVVLKAVGVEPRVVIYDLAGRQVAVLRDDQGRDQKRFEWSGHDQGGGLVQPGLYFCRIDLGADAGEDTALRLISVTY